MLFSFPQSYSFITRKANKLTRKMSLAKYKKHKRCFWQSWYIKQCKLYLSPFDKSSEDLALVSAERNILTIEVPIPSLYFSQQAAFGILAIAKQPPHAHIVGKQGQQQGILTIPFEVFKAFPKVGTEQGVCLPFRHIRCETLSWLQLMPISNIWIILPAVWKSHSTLTPLGKQNCSLWP